LFHYGIKEEFLNAETAELINEAFYGKAEYTQAAEIKPNQSAEKLISGPCQTGST
jgi:hypothetical protein